MHAYVRQCDCVVYLSTNVSLAYRQTQSYCFLSHSLSQKYFI
uniref:Uncharacterized protein n=1 Tax=Anguilla anguilla TaxID=7936 RepID=A0A0E9QRB8_ANGAN